MHRAGGGPEQDDAPGVAAEFGRVLADPGHGGGDVLRSGGVFELRGQPVGHVHPHQAVAHRPQGDVVVIGRAGLALVAHDEAAAVDEQHHRSGPAGRRRREHVQAVARVRTVGGVADDLDPGIGLRLLLARIDRLGARNGGQDLSAEGADLAGDIAAGGSGHGVSWMVG